MSSNQLSMWSRSSFRSLAAAFGTETAKHKLPVAEDTFPESTRRRLRHVIPVHILNLAASVANEMVMAHAFQIKSSGTTLGRHFAHQACLHQVPQIVVGGG